MASLELFGCIPDDKTMTKITLTTPALVGNWILVPKDQKDIQDYPAHIEFREDGSYLVPMDNEVFRQWQSGDYEVIDEETIKIQTANDAMVSYRCRLVEDQLTFTDETGIKVTYHREH